MKILTLRTSNKKEEEGVLHESCEVLASGGILVFPTDTVYGLLCDATNEEAVKKLLTFKQRQAGKPISVFVSDFDQMQEVVELRDEVKERLKTLLPGPYTVVLPSKHRLLSLLESEYDTLGVRIPDHNLVRALVKRFGKPLTATSANLASQSPHYSIQSFQNQTSEKRQSLISLVVDAGELPHNKPSTVVDYSEGDIKVLRVGDILEEAKTYLSRSEEETKQIAKTLLKTDLETTQLKEKKPLVYILKGEVGAGKTVFVKGVGELLKVDRIVSPTYVMYYEYPVEDNHRVKKLIHADLYNLKDTEELTHLRLDSYLKDDIVMCIEWGERSSELYEQMKDKAQISVISFIHKDEHTREITIQKVK